jgi:hypothetical protein
MFLTGRLDALCRLKTEIVLTHWAWNFFRMLLCYALNAEVLIKTLTLPHRPINSDASASTYETVKNRVDVTCLFHAPRLSAAVIKEFVKWEVACRTSVFPFVSQWMLLRREKRVVRASECAITLKPDSSPVRVSLCGILIFKKNKRSIL